MNLNKIKRFFSFGKKRKRQKVIFAWAKQTTFIKKRVHFSIKNKSLEKLKFFWNNKSSYYLLLTFIFISLSLYIVFWPVFKIKNIEIIKQDDITNMIISYKSVDSYRWKSIFSIKKSKIINSLKDYQHNIKMVKTNIVLPNTIKIKIESFKEVFNTDVNNKSFILTQNGVLIPKAHSKSLKKLEIHNEVTNNQFLDYKKYLETEYITKILSIIENLESDLPKIKLKEFKYYVVEREFHVKTDKNTILIFDLDWWFDEQINKLIVFSKDTLKKTTPIYIDLRIDWKVFYCSKDDEKFHIEKEKEKQCLNNLKKLYK